MDGKSVSSDTTYSFVAESDITVTAKFARRSSGGGGGSSSSSYTIKLDTNGGNVLKNISVKKGQAIGTIETPKKEGFVFTGWYSDKECTKAYDKEGAKTMKNNIVCTNIRFNLDNPLHQKAWEYLHTMDKSQFKSYTHAAALSITEMFDKFYKLQDDPYFETRQREEQFVTQIVEAVEKALNEALPGFLLSCIASYANLQISPTAKQANESGTENEEIDWDFISES